MRRILACLTVSLSLLNASCTRGPAMTEYRNATGATLKIPASWKAVDNLVDIADLQFSDDEHQAHFITVTEVKAGLEHNTLERYAKFAREPIRDGLRLPEWFGPKNVEINGLKGIQYEIRGYSGDERYVYLHTVIEGREHFHQLVGWTTAGKRDENWPILEKITASFHE